MLTWFQMEIFVKAKFQFATNGTCFPHVGAEVEKPYLMFAKLFLVLSKPQLALFMHHAKQQHAARTTCISSAGTCYLFSYSSLRGKRKGYI